MQKNYYSILIVLIILLACPSIVGAQVVINEYSVSNFNQFFDNYNRNEDWIELYNTSSSPVNIGGYYLSDRAGNPFKWQIPANTVIPGNGFLIVWASGRDEATGGHYHTNYRMTQTKGEYIVFSSPLGVILESRQLEITQLNHSRGRVGDGSGEWGIFTSPTPGSTNSNSQAYERYAATPVMSHSAGFYNEEIVVTITCDEPDAQIRFTTNGHTPGTGSTLYTTPLQLNTTTLVQAKAYSSNPLVLPGLIGFNTFFINEGPFTLPVFSVSGDQMLQLLNGNASLEPHGTIEYFNADGIRTSSAYGEYNKHGQDSWVHPQRSIDFIARDEMGYNHAVLDQIIPITPRDEFQRIIFRASGDDNYPGKDSSAHMRDIWTQNLAEISGMHLDVRKGSRCILFANGQYWGVYAAREKVNDHDFTKFYYNQDKWDLQFLMFWGNLWARYGGQQAIDDWMELRSYILNNDMSNPFVFGYVSSKYDWKSLVDYVIINSFVVCSDWLNWNVGWWRGLNPEGEHQKWGYILWDEDAILGHYINYTGIPGQHPFVPPCFHENLSSWSDPQKHIEILNKLKANDEFYQYYVSRYIDLKNTAFVKEYLMQYIDSTAGVIAPEMPRHIARWGGNIPKWESNVQKIRNFVSDRCDYLETGLKDCYNLTGPYQLTVNVYPPGTGNIKLNSLHINDYPWTGDYFGGIDVVMQAMVTNNNYEFDYWEFQNHQPLPNDSAHWISFEPEQWDQITAHFKPRLYSDSLVINEINYRSASWFNPEDWVEFYNPHNYALDITDWVFKDDNDNHAFAFPGGTIIDAEGYLVLCQDTSAFKIHFPNVTNYLGNIDFGFSSNGELLRLYNAEGILIDTVHYQNSDPWPPEANGGGPSLELIHPTLDNAIGENWMASALYGTPGAMNSLLVSTPELFQKKPNLAVSLFPNPARSHFTIYTHDNYFIRDGVISIYNTFGIEVLKQVNIVSDKIEVDVNGLPEGLYIFKLYDLSNNQSATGKVMIQ